MVVNTSDPTSIEKLLFFSCILLIMFSWGFRVRIFTRYGSYPVIKELTAKTSVLSFGDLLSVWLFRVRKILPDETRRTVFWFIVLYWLGSLLMLFAFISFGFRNWL